MIFLGNLELVSGTNYKVGLVHYMPFDEEHGIKANDNTTLLTQSEIEQMGILVDSLPQEKPPIGQMTSGIFIDKFTNTVSYTYMDIPLNQEQVMTNLQSQNAQMLFALVNGGLM